MMFKTRVAGIPCKADVRCTCAGRPAITTGHTDFREPAEDAEYEVDLYDRRERAAPWLERKMTDADRDELIAQYREIVAQYGEP